MIITGMKLGMLKVPLRTPFKTALRSVDHIEDVIVMLETDSGHIGYGGAPATTAITGESHSSIIEAIRTSIIPHVIDQSIEDLNQLTGRIQTAIVGNTSAKAAVEIAIYDLFSQLHRIPLYKMLGGGEPQLATDITISVDYIKKMVEDSLAAVELGFEILKIKVGKDINLDIERVKAIWGAVSNKAILRIDANQAWTPRQTVTALRTWENAGVELELIEQPVKADDIKGLQYITERVQTPVMADESIFGPKAALELIRTRAVDIINIKLMKSGGISNAIKIADIAEIHDVKCMIGCMLESSISLAAAAHVAVAKSSVITKVDLDASYLAQYNPVSSSLRFNNADISIADIPGLGIDKIDRLALLD